MTDFLNGIHYNSWILPALLIIPAVGALLVGLHGASRTSLADADANAGPARQIAFWTLTIEFIVSCGLWWSFKIGVPGWQAGVDYAWIPAWGARFSLGVDGISLMLVLLTTLTMPLAILGGWTAIKSKVHAYLAVLLILTSAMLGVFLTRDLFLFYVMWELMLIPMYLIIGIWGGQRRIYASLKFFIYTMFGSLLMLVAIIYLGIHNRDLLTGIPNFSFDAMVASGSLTPKTSLWLFGAFFMAFAVKVPIFPFHTWLPDAHTEAPTAGSVILAGIMLKMGTFGFLRFALPLFPGSAMNPTVRAIVLTLGVIGIIYGALVALVQPDFKKIVAYSSVSHLGFVMLGIFALTVQSVQGALLVMINHGISTGALFLLVGMLYERRHTRMLTDYGGIARVVPMFAVALTLVSFSSIGLPGLNGFVGEFMVLLGSFRTYPVTAAIATTGIVFAAWYLLRAIQRVMFNKLDNAENEHIPDLNWREIGLLTPLLICIVWIGVYPAPILRRMQSSAEQVVRTVQTNATRAASQTAAFPGGE
ncbi:MAG TPA: NADH-quinone oxidoreductase subunit M [Gemmatimonadaceae bacterium]